MEPIDILRVIITLLWIWTEVKKIHQSRVDRKIFQWKKINRILSNF